MHSGSQMVVPRVSFPLSDRTIGRPSWSNMNIAVVVGTAMLVGIIWMLLDLWKQRGTSGPTRWPLVGAVLEVLWHYDHMHDWLISYFRKVPTFLVELPNVTYIYTVHPSNVEHILKNNFPNYPKGELFHEAMEIFLGDGIFNTDGELWRKQRKTAIIEFASRTLRDYSSGVFREHGIKLAAILTHAATLPQAVDMQDLFMRLTLDSICKLSFGIEVGTLAPSLPQVPFAKAFETTNEVVSHRFIDPWWKIKRFFKIGSEAKIVRSAKAVDEFTYGVIETRKAEVRAAQKSGDRAPTTTRGDLFTRFLALNENEGDEQLMNKSLRDTMLNFVIAGRDTTAVTLSWFVYMMTLHPDVAHKLYKELCSLEEERERGSSNEERNGHSGDEESFNQRVVDFSQHLTIESLSKLHYLTAAIMETLRLYPAVPQDPKGVLADDVLPDGTKVRKGNMVCYCPYAMGRMEYIWGPDASEFKPERWITDDGVIRTESPFKFTAFQAGPRICLGKDMAYLQMRMVTAILCRFFQFQVVPGFSVKYRQMSTLLLANGLQVNVTKRLT